MSFFLEPITRLFWPQFSLFSSFQLDCKTKGGFKSIWGPQISNTCSKNWIIGVFKSQDKFKFNKKILKNDRDIFNVKFCIKINHLVDLVVERIDLFCWFLLLKKSLPQDLCFYLMFNKKIHIYQCIWAKMTFLYILFDLKMDKK